MSSQNRGDEVVRSPLLRDELLGHLSPWRLSDLQRVLELRCYRGVLSDGDLKECYSKRLWGFVEREFVLANWETMSVDGMKRRVREAQPSIRGRSLYPTCKKALDSLWTKEEIAREYWELTCVPERVYKTAVCGVHVLRAVKAGDVKARDAGEYLASACRAGLHARVIRRLAGECGERDIHWACGCAAEGGHNDVVDVLVSEYGAAVDEECSIRAASAGHNATIDHLVDTYGLDVSATDRFGWNALRSAAWNDRVKTVEHLVVVHNVDVHVRDAFLRRTALDLIAGRVGSECARVLRRYMSERPPRPP